MKKDEKIELLTKNIGEWINSSEGKEQWSKVLDKAKQDTEKLEESLRVDPQKLNRHFTL